MGLMRRLPDCYLYEDEGERFILQLASPEAHSIIRAPDGYLWGTEEDLEELLSLCEENNLRVILRGNLKDREPTEG